MAPFMTSFDHAPPRYSCSPDLSFFTDNLSLNDNAPSLASSKSDQSADAGFPTTPADRVNSVNRASGGSGGCYMTPTYSPQNPDTPLTSSNLWQANNSGGGGFKSALPPQTSGFGFDAAAAQMAMLDAPQALVTERHLQCATSYAFHRGNGRYTRLVPLDELPPMVGYHSTPTQGPEGLIVLPIPHRHQPLPAVRYAPVPPGYMLTPSTAPSPGMGVDSGGAGYAFKPRGGFGTPNGPKREKIYCDKWVHDGVCAFAQQGCKYKHEMPRDVATQRALGLFHGLPAWFKREHGLELRGKGEVGRGDAAKEVDVVGQRLKESLRTSQPGGLSSWRLPAPNRSSGGFANPAQNALGSIGRPGQARNGGISSSIHAPELMSKGGSQNSSPTHGQSSPFGFSGLSTPTSAAAAGDQSQRESYTGFRSETKSNPFNMLSSFGQI